MTFVGPWRDDIFREAIMREKARGGQVFFVHNRIETIDAVAERIRALFPDIRVDVVHGRMEEKKLEEAMIKFVRRIPKYWYVPRLLKAGLTYPVPILL
jgi:transcription-repair coupling factor (superfamily II helicase)